MKLPTALKRIFFRTRFRGNRMYDVVHDMYTEEIQLFIFLVFPFGISQFGEKNQLLLGVECRS